ncbi:MAG: hypothetical protein AB7P14_05035 [Blastocatellales bacterium]
MRCPNCQTDVPEGHFYCPGCQVPIYSYVPSNQKSKGGRIERAGKRLVDLILILVLIGAGVVLARAIKWKEVFNGFKPVVESSPSAKPERDASGGLSSKRRKASSDPQQQGSHEETSKPASAESVRELKQKIEELPSSDETRPIPKSVATPTPKPSNNEPISFNTPKSPVKCAFARESSAQTKMAKIELEIRPAEARQNNNAGFVSVNSYLPSRIYVDGHFPADPEL